MYLHALTLPLLFKLLGGMSGIAVASPAQGPTGQPGAKPASAASLRLPAGVRPVRQAIELTLDPRQERFQGAVAIDLEIGAPTDTLWLNAVDLTIGDATLRTAGGSRSLTVVPGPEGQVGFKADAPLAKGPATLQIRYQGPLSRRDTEGLFAQQEGGEWYAFTQFEPLGARRAFPCFDEPGDKIPWQVTLHTDARDRAFSNTPEVSRAPGDGGRTKTVFAETKPLPSYLVAVAVGPLDIVDLGTAGRKGTPIRILVPRGRGADARWAAEITPRILESLETYFDMPYPYEKLDQIAVPSFPGAMENAGLVIYGQTMLLQKAGAETIADRRLLASVMAHELAHHWFGNLVTMAWWDDLWLNEAFASWMGERVTAAVGPGWGIDVSMVRDRSDALRHDSLATARRIRQPIESSHDIANAFDPITYSKGQALLEMIESWLGDERFKGAVRRYLRSREWRNATFDDFATALSAEAGQDLKPVISSFLDQTGAPLLSVALACDGGAPRASLAQRRFTPLGSKSSPQTWQLPVCLRYDAGGTAVRECHLLKDASTTLPLKASTCPAWLLGNDGFSGYYRTAHAPALTATLLEPGKAPVSKAERVGLLLDVAALVSTGDVLAADALTLASRYAGDDEPELVRSSIAIVNGVAPFVPRERQDAFASLVRDLYGRRARELGWTARPSDSDDVQLLRSRIMQAVGLRGRDPEVIREALALAKGWLDGKSQLPPDGVEPVLRVAAQSGDRNYFDRLLAEARTSPDRKRRELALMGLDAFRAPEIVPSALAIVLDERIDVRESLRLLFGLARQPETRTAAYEFLVKHYDAIKARLPQGSAMDFSAFLPMVGSGFCDAGKRAEVEAFFAPRVKGTSGGPRNLAQTLETIELCAAQRQVQEPSVSAYLAQRQP